MKLRLATKVNWRVQRISRDLIGAPSVWFIVALAALALLEIPSTTGRLLDRWGADVVAGWLGQLALLGLCVDALRGKLPRPVVLIPLLFYVSYYFAYWEQGAHIKLKSEELRRTNPGRIVAFDPRSSALAMDKADAFAASYSIPVVYARDPSFVGDEYLSYRLVATDRIVSYLSRNRDGVQVFSVYWNDRILPNVRELKYPERPRHQIISVSVADNPGQGWKDFNIGTQTTSVSTDGRLIGTFRSAYVLRLPPAPMFTLGCTQSLTSSKRMCRAEFVTERVPIESRPDSVDRTLYDDPVSVMLGIRQLSEKDMQSFHGFDGDVQVRPAPGEDEAFRALGDVIDGRSPILSWASGFLIAGDPARLAPFAGGMAKRFVDLTAADDADFPGRRQQADLLAAGIAALRPADFAGVQDLLLDLARRDSVREQFPLLYLRLADAGRKLFPIYRDQFLAQGATQQEKLLAALAICRVGLADSELISAIDSEWRASDSGAADSDNYRAALFVALEKLGQEETLRGSPQASSTTLQGWYDAVLAGRGKTDVGPNNCMPMDWPGDDYAPPIMAPRLRWAQQQWRAAD